MNVMMAYGVMKHLILSFRAFQLGEIPERDGCDCGTVFLLQTGKHGFSVARAFAVHNSRFSVIFS